MLCTYASTAFIVPSLSSLRTATTLNVTMITQCADVAASPQRLGSRIGTLCSSATAGERASGSSSDVEEMSTARVIQIFRYPVKSARAESLSEAVVTPEGLEGDRRFLVTTGDGRYRTQREVPALATLDARVEGNVLSLRAGPRALNVTIRRSGNLAPASLFGTPLKLTDQGPEVGAWIGEWLTGVGSGDGNPLAKLQQSLFGPPYRLLRAPDPVPSSTPPLRGGAGLADLSPLLLVCEETLAELNARRAAEGKAPTSMARFRPNLVLRGCGKPHAEDMWIGRTLTIGAGANFRVTSACPRCGVPDVSQTSGVRDAAAKGPMGTLKSYRSRAGQGVLFGIYVAPVGTPAARVRVGDTVNVG